MTIFKSDQALLGEEPYTEVINRHLATPNKYKDELNLKYRASDAAAEAEGIEELSEELDETYLHDVNELNQDYSTALALRGQERGRLRVQLDPARLQDALEEARANLVNLAVDAHDGLRETYLQMLRAQRHLNKFKTDRNIKRPLVPGLPFWVFMLTTMTAVVVEGAINAQSFFEVLPGGRLAGLMQAMLLAGINVTVAIGGGAAARNIIAPEPARRVLGTIGVALYAVFLILFTGLVCHYRVALHVNQAEAMSEAVMRLIHTPLAIYDFSAVMLGVTCVIAAVVAFVASFKARDPATGYAEHVEALNRAKVAYSAMRERYVVSIDGVTTQPWNYIDECEEEALAARERFDLNMIETVALRTAYDGQLANLEVARRSGRNAIKAAYCRVAGAESIGNLPTRDLPTASPRDDALTEALEDEVAFTSQLDSHMKKHVDAAIKTRSEIRSARTVAWHGAEPYFVTIENKVLEQLGIDTVPIPDQTSVFATPHSEKSLPLLVN